MQAATVAGCLAGYTGRACCACATFTHYRLMSTCQPCRQPNPQISNIIYGILLVRHNIRDNHKCETMTMRWMRAMPVLSGCNPTDRIGACDGFIACLHFRFDWYSSSVCLDGRRTLHDRCAFV